MDSNETPAETQPSAPYTKLLVLRSLAQCALSYADQKNPPIITADHVARDFASIEDIDDILSTQGQTLNALFHRLIDSSLFRGYVEDDRVKLALRAQKQCADTILKHKKLKNSSKRTIKDSP
jgi:hypothetical protein